MSSADDRAKDRHALTALVAALHPRSPSFDALLADPATAARAVALATAHKVSALLARALDRAGALATIGEPVRQALRKSVLDQEFVRARLEAAALEACDAFDAAGVPYLFLKGTAVGRIVHGDPSLRPISDVDLLVPPERFYDAMAALGAAGFELPAKQVLDYWREAYYNVGVVSKQGAEASVEVHWSIAQRGRHHPDIDGLFARAQSFAFNGRPARALGATDLLLHQALHHAYHYFEPKLMWIFDLALIHAAAPQAGALLGRARAWGMSVPLALSVRQVEKVFPGLVDPSLVAFALGHARARLIATRFGSDDPVALLEETAARHRQLLLAVLMLDRPSQALRSVAGWAWRAARFGDRAGTVGELSKGREPERS